VTRPEKVAPDYLRSVEALGFDGAEIGLVCPEQLVVRIADPEWIGDIVEQHRHRTQVASGDRQLALSLHEFGPVAGHVPQAQDRPSADGAALHVDEAAADAARGQAEGLTALLELFESAFDGSGIGRCEPGAEGQGALGRRVLADDGGIALEARFSVPAMPAHEELTFRAHEKRREIVRAPQGVELVSQTPFHPGGTLALVHQQQGGGGREGDEAHEEAEIGGVVQVEAVKESEEVRGPLRDGEQQVVGEGGLGGSGQEHQGQGYTGGADEGNSPVAAAIVTFPMPGHAVRPFLCWRPDDQAKLDRSPAALFDATEVNRLRMNGTAGAGSKPQHSRSIRVHSRLPPTPPGRGLTLA
jgi:hypothetical protein